MDDAHPLTRIGPSAGWRALGLHDIFRYRDLIKFLILRDMKIRYQQTLLGGLWAIIQPLGTTAAFTLVFGNLAKVPSEGIPYPLFSFTGLVIWTFFNQAMTSAVGSLIGSTQLVEKVYFPRLVLPLSSVLRGLPDLGIAFACLIVAMLAYGVVPGMRALWVIPFTLLALVAATGVGCGLGALNVRFRDVRQTMPLLSQLWLFATPVAYPASLAPEKWRLLLGLNPMTGVVEGYRWALLGGTAPSASLLGLSTASALVMLVLGVAVFRRMERSFADII